MGLEYLKITPEIMLKISAYDQEQQGRLVMAMIAYALAGEEPQFDGVEKFIWPTLKQDIDNCSAHVEKQKANGSKGGRPPKQETQDKPNENTVKPKETQDKPNENTVKPKETQDKPNENTVKPKETQDKPNESLNINTNTNTNTNSKKEDVVVSARTRATATAAPDEPVIAFDGSDVTEDIEREREAYALIKRYRLNDNDKAIEALKDDIAQYGLEAVSQALDEASLADKCGGLSVKYYRTFIGAQPRSAPSQGTRTQAETTNPFLKMLREEGYGT